MRTRNWRDFKIFKKSDDLLPAYGQGETLAEQASVCVCKLVKFYYNDGDVYDNRFGLSGWWNDVSSYANWLYAYVPATKGILDGIKEIGSDEGAYSELLYDLCETVEEALPSLEGKPKAGSVYEAEGPFEFAEAREEEEEAKPS